MPRSKYSKDLEGRKFNRTTIISFSHRVADSKGYRYYWLCHCECGKEHVSDARAVFRGEVQSCGCLNRDSICKFKKHGHAAQSGTSREFNSWKKMRSRCTNPKNEFAHRYSKRGIRFCKGFDDFVHFLKVLGNRPPDTTLDRKDNDGHYSCGTCSECLTNNWPLNCRWATTLEQNSNKSITIYLPFHGKSTPLPIIASRLNISRERLYSAYKTSEANAIALIQRLAE